MGNRRRLLQLFGIGLIALALLLALYLSIAYLGYERGQELRVTRAVQTRTAAISGQIDHAAADVEEGNYRLALRRLEWVLEREPDNEAAIALQVEAEGALARSLEPGATPTSSATPTVEGQETATRGPSTGATATVEAAAASELRRLVGLVRDEEWEEAISAIIVFQSEFPDYERRRSDQLLYDAYVGQGLEELYGDQVELGIYYLSQAEALGDLPGDVLDQRQWAELYLGGVAYYGINSEVSLFYFRQLCAAAPFYQDACGTLFDILIQAGDRYAANQEWCPAESLYVEAYALEDGSVLTQKLSQAREGCRDATPTAGAPITATLPLETRR